MTEDDESLDMPHRTPRGIYDGAELRKFTGRPGAMDCFALPSRMGETLRFRSGEVKSLAKAGECVMEKV